MKKEKLTQKEIDQTNAILGFDPTQLEKYTNEYYESVEKADISDFVIDEEQYKIEIQEIIDELNTRHVNRCKHINKPNKRLYYWDVYLAGKIQQNGWREQIVGYRCGHLYGGDHGDISKYTIQYNDKITITGPWFLACDHGCYHGDNSHGLGINQLGCPDANDDNYTEKEVYNICTSQINKSDIVFAYIDDNTCYGSMYEIGYAKAQGKIVILIFDNEKLMSDMWFMCQGADIVDILGDMSVKEKFDNVMKLYN